LLFLHDGLTWGKVFENKKIPFSKVNLVAFSGKKIIWQDLAKNLLFSHFLNLCFWL
jgi:hypothetical protein